MISMRPCPFCGNVPFSGIYPEKATTYPSEHPELSEDEKIRQYGRSSVQLDLPVTTTVMYVRISCWRCELYMSERVPASTPSAHALRKLIDRWNDRAYREPVAGPFAIMTGGAVSKEQTKALKMLGLTISSVTAEGDGMQLIVNGSADPRDIEHIPGLTIDWNTMSGHDKDRE